MSTATLRRCRSCRRPTERSGIDRLAGDLCDGCFSRALAAAEGRLEPQLPRHLWPRDDRALRRDPDTGKWLAGSA